MRPVCIMDKWIQKCHLIGKFDSPSCKISKTLHARPERQKQHQQYCTAAPWGKTVCGGSGHYIKKPAGTTLNTVMAYDKLSVIYFSKQLSTNGTILPGDKWLKETLCSSERRHWTEFLGRFQCQTWAPQLELNCFNRFNNTVWACRPRRPGLLSSSSHVPVRAKS